MKQKMEYETKQEIEPEVGQRKKQKRILFLALAIIVAVILGLGHINFHNELERDVIAEAFLGYVDETIYSGTVYVEKSWLPVEFAALGVAEPQTLTFQQSGRIGVFAKLVYYENRFEDRTWLSGRLLRRESEYYYKCDGPLMFKPVYDTLEPTVDIRHIRGQNYDYTAFCGV